MLRRPRAQAQDLVQRGGIEAFHRRAVHFLEGGGDHRGRQADVGLAGGVLEVDFRVALRVGGQQHVAVVLPAFAAEAADLVGQVDLGWIRARTAGSVPTRMP